MFPTWKITKRKICNARSADVQDDTVLREGELRFMAVELIAFQEVIPRFVRIQDGQLSTPDSLFYLRLLGDYFTEWLVNRFVEWSAVRTDSTTKRNNTLPRPVASG